MFLVHRSSIQKTQRSYFSYVRIYRREKKKSELLSGSNWSNRSCRRTGATGHAEGIQLMFDPSIISYQHLVEIFFAMHNPTTINQQDYDQGTQYRSAIFYHDTDQKQTAEKIKKELTASGKYPNPIVTEIVPFEAFYEAEKHHQDFYDNNRTSPYCMLIIDPKIKKLLSQFSTDVKEEYK
jgi:peptide-methionine (S)-S-oxide reductase